MQKVILSFIVLLLLLGAFQLASGWFLIVIHLLSLVALILITGVFLLSLRTGKLALITRYAFILETHLTQAEILYTWRATLIWSLVLSLVSLSKLLLTVFLLLDHPTPKLLIHLDLLAFSLIPLLFIGEFALRKRIFPEKNHGTFIGFFYQTLKIPFYRILRFKKA